MQGNFHQLNLLPFLRLVNSPFSLKLVLKEEQLFLFILFYWLYIIKPKYI